jgi:ABC-type nitrate/sulfonate/bicarbonate transport system substrate-binding protein
VRKDSPLKKLSDLKGKKFGVWSRGAGATKALEVLAMDGFKLDLNRDVQTIEIAGPALMALLDKGEVDAMFNLSSLSIAAASQPDKYRLLFSPDEYWKEKTGAPLVWSAPTDCVEGLDRRRPPARQERRRRAARIVAVVASELG